jgi:hypothetical protein
MSDQNIYGEVNSVSDIRDINRQIRKEMRSVNERSQVTELKKRSDYLCTLTRAPSWQQKFGSKADRLLAVAKEENERSTRLANSSARRKDLGPANYDPWGE